MGTNSSCSTDRPASFYSSSFHSNSNHPIGSSSSSSLLSKLFRVDCKLLPGSLVMAGI
jgi:hypothetical protein